MKIQINERVNGRDVSGDAREKEMNRRILTIEIIIYNENELHACVCILIKRSI